MTDRIDHHPFLPSPADARAGASVGPALSGAPVGWADTIGTQRAPADLRRIRDDTYAAAFARGFHAPLDGGGGALAWTHDRESFDNSGTIVAAQHTAVRRGCWKRIENAVFNVRWFGARGDGVTDDFAAIQAAINAAGSRGGGTVYLPPGRYRIMGGLTLDQSGVVVRGAGASSVIAPGPDNIGTFHAGGAIDARTRGIGVMDLAIDEELKGWNLLVDAQFVDGLVLQRLDARAGRDGIRIEGCTDVTVRDVRLMDYRGGGVLSAYLGLVGGGQGDDRRRCRGVQLDNVQLGGDFRGGMTGLDVSGLVEQVALTDVRIFNAGSYGVRVRNGNGASRAPCAITAHSLECRSADDACASIDEASSVTFTASHFSGARDGANLVVGAAARDIAFLGGSTTGARRAGLVVAGQDVELRGMHVRGNSTGVGQAPHAYSGIEIADSARGVTIQGCRIGDAAASQLYGIDVAAGADGIAIVANVCSGNADAGIFSRGGTTSTKVIASNVF
jgi:hypothetical protein